MGAVEYIKSFYKKVYSAFTLLTVLPLPGWELDFNRTTPFFSWVGVVLAGIYFLVFLGTYDLLSPLVLAFTLVALDGFLTGGLHLDGFSDWIDGIYSRKEGEELMAVLKDSNAGAIGAAGLSFLVLGKVVFLSEIIGGEFPVIWLILFPWFARFLMYLIIISYPYPSGKKGLGQICQDDYSFSDHLMAFLPVFILLGVIYIFYPNYLEVSLFVKIVTACVITGLFTYFFIKKLAEKLGGVNGDGYGACCEFSQVVLLFVGAIFA